MAWGGGGKKASWMQKRLPRMLFRVTEWGRLWSACFNSCERQEGAPLWSVGEGHIEVYSQAELECPALVIWPLANL